MKSDIVGLVVDSRDAVLLDFIEQYLELKYSQTRQILSGFFIFRSNENLVVILTALEEDLALDKTKAVCILLDSRIATSNNNPL